MPDDSAYALRRAVPTSTLIRPRRVTRGSAPCCARTATASLRFVPDAVSGPALSAALLVLLPTAFATRREPWRRRVSLFLPRSSRESGVPGAARSHIGRGPRCGSSPSLPVSGAAWCGKTHQCGATCRRPVERRSGKPIPTCPSHARDPPLPAGRGAFQVRSLREERIARSGAPPSSTQGRSWIRAGDRRGTTTRTAVRNGRSCSPGHRRCVTPRGRTCCGQATSCASPKGLRAPTGRSTAAMRSCARCAPRLRGYRSTSAIPTAAVADAQRAGQRGPHPPGGGCGRRRRRRRVRPST
jgi:hypothetical protein